MTCKPCVDNMPRKFINGRWVHPFDGSIRALDLDCLFQGDAPRKGDWIQTFTGRQFFALDPRPEDFHILDIAAGLRNARYSSQSIRVQTVLEHSSLMRREAHRRGYTLRQQRGVLLHDCSEAYFVDVPRPIKRDLANYLEIEDGIMRAASARFDFDWPMPPEVKELDNAILHDEMMQNMAAPPAAWRQLSGSPLGVTVNCWPSDRAMVEFLWDCAQVGVI